MIGLVAAFIALVAAAGFVMMVAGFVKYHGGLFWVGFVVAAVAVLVYGWAFT